MSYASTIAPPDIRDYAKTHGWLLIPDAAADRLFVLHHPRHPLKQLVVPMDIERADYHSAVRTAIQTLSRVEERSYEMVEASLIEAPFDTLRLSISPSRGQGDSLPLSYATRAIKGAENSLRAAACSEVHQQPYHPRMNRSEAQELVAAAQVRHTERGSFVIKVACPLDAVASEEADLFPRKPFVRRVMLGLVSGVGELVNSLEGDSLDSLVGRVIDRQDSSVSANLCDSLLAFEDESMRVNLAVSVDWSARLEMPATPYLEPVRVQWSYFPRIAEVARALRTSTPSREQNFVGIVDELKGDFGQGEEMKGEVIFNLIGEHESDTIKVRADLDTSFHAIAHRAYAPPKPFIQIRGVLQPGNQPRRLTDIKHFRIIEEESTET